MTRSPRDVTVLLPDPSLPDVTKVDAVFSAEDLDAIERVRAALAELEGTHFDFHTDHRRLLERLESAPPQLVLNLCDTGFRNVAAHELHVAALLELFDIPYTGSPPVCLGLCYDKANVLAIAADCGVAVPAQRELQPDADLDLSGFPLPAIVKPNRADGGFGITAQSVVATAAELQARVDAMREEFPEQSLLVQEFLTGDEYGVSLLGNPGDDFRALPIMVVDWNELPAELPRILGYESKTLPDSPYWTDLRYRPASVDDRTTERLVTEAERLFQRLGCRDYARFDYRAGADGTLRLLEVNPNPAWCWDGKLNLMAGFAGLSYSELFGAILDAATRRCFTGGRAR